MKFNTIKFINEIKKRPALWDSRNRKYTFEERNQAWKEIFDLYDTVENIAYTNRTELSLIIQKRWKNLRDNYVKFSKRMQTNPNAKVKYVFAKRLNFLDKVIISTTSKKRQISEELAEDEEEEEKEELQNVLKTPQIKMSSSRSDDDGDDDDDDDNDYGIQGPEEVDLDEIYRRDSIDLIMDNTIEGSRPLKKSNSQCEGMKCFYDHSKDRKKCLVQERDECTVYGELVGVKLRKLNSRTRAYVQHLINNTLFEAEMGKYNHVNSTKPTANCFPLPDQTNYP